MAALTASKPQWKLPLMNWRNPHLIMAVFPPQPERDKPATIYLSAQCNLFLDNSLIFMDQRLWEQLHGFWCFSDELWQYCNLSLMQSGGATAYRFVSVTVYPCSLLFFYLLIRWTVLKVTELCMFGFWWFIHTRRCIYAFNSIRDTQRGSVEHVNTLTGPHPVRLKENQHPRRSFLGGCQPQKALSCCRFVSLALITQRRERTD